MAEIDKLESIAARAHLAPHEQGYNEPPGVKEEFAATFSPERVLALLAVCRESSHLLDDFDCHAEPKQAHPRYAERLRRALAAFDALEKP